METLNKIKPKVCCACKRSNAAHPETAYMIIPKGPATANYETIKTDYLRKQFFRSQFRRNLFITNLKLPHKAKTTGLQLCDRHQLYEKKYMIPWVDINGQKQVMEEIVVAPIVNSAA